MVAGTIEMAASVPRIAKGQFEIVVSLRLLAEASEVVLDRCLTPRAGTVMQRVMRCSSRAGHRAEKRCAAGVSPLGRARWNGLWDPAGS